MKTKTGAYIKKDKDHDILDNPINPKKHLIPKDEVRKLVIDGKKYFWMVDKMEVQCAKCLYQFQVMALPDDGSNERQLYFVEEKCHCEEGKDKK